MPVSRFARLVFGLFLAALTVRLFGLNWGDGHWLHAGERRVAETVQGLGFAPLHLHPKSFADGSLLPAVTRSVQAVAGSLRPSARDFGSSILTGRSLSALWGALTVALLAWFGRRLYGERVGLLAGGLLAGAVLHLQSSHVATNDAATAFLVLLALTLLVRANASSAARDFAFGGAAVGLAASSDLSALLLLPAVAAASITAPRGERPSFRAGLFGLASASAAAAFAAGSPFALLAPRAYFGSLLAQGSPAAPGGVLGPPEWSALLPNLLHGLSEHLLWGLGPLLGAAVVWGTVRTLRLAAGEGGAGERVLASFAIPFFAVTALLAPGPLSRLLPLYPLLCLWAANALAGGIGESLGPSRPPRRSLLPGLVVAGTVVYAAAFLTIYTRPHTMMDASRWLYANLPLESPILTQGVAEEFPFPVGGHSPGDFKRTSLVPREGSDEADVRRLVGQLTSSEAVVFQTKWLDAEVLQAAARPLTGRFFRSLFAGDLGFTLEKEIASRPGFFGLCLLDELADRSFSIDDHPKVVVFRNRARLAGAEIAARAAGFPSRPVTRQEALLAPHGFVNDERPGTSSRSSAGALLLLALFAEILGLAGYAILRRFLAPRPGLYALGKVAGLLFFAVGAWLPVALGLLPFTRPVLLVTAAVLGAGSLVALGRRTPGALAAREVRWTEGVVWGSFLFFALVRALNPEVFWGEKPMDFSFLNLLYRTTSLPPVEPWFAGTTLSYTYFGHFAAAAVGKALAIPPPLMFNLAIALVGSLAAAGLFAAGAILGNGLGTGLLATALGLFAGNLSGLRALAARPGSPFDTFWATSRVIPGTINEYPFWSFLFADLHAHVLAVPFALGFVALLLHSARQEQEEPQTAPPGASSARVAAMVFAALFLGASVVTNGWGAPTWIALSFVLLVAAALSRPFQGASPFQVRATGPAVARAAATSAAVAVAALVLFRPFWTSFSAPDQQVGWEKGLHAGAWDTANHFGLFFLVLVPFLFLVLWRAFAAGRRRPGPGALFFLAVALLLVPATLVAWQGVHPLLRPAPSIREFALLMALLGAVAALHPSTGARERLAAALAAFGFALVAGCETVYVWDRMNTVFKFYFDAWLIFSISSALVCRDLAAGLYGRRWTWVWRGLLVAGGTAALVTAALALVGAVRTNRVGGPRGTLDGTAYLRTRDPEGAALYDWIGRSIPGLPAIAEAWGPSYQGFSRVSMNTGLPTLLGWDYHVFQRGKSWEEIDRRKADLRTLYSAKTVEAAGAVLGRYQIRYVVAGPLESQTYLGGKPPAFDSFDKLLKPVFRKGQTTLYEVSRTWRSPSSAMFSRWSGFDSVPVQVMPPPEPGTTLREPRGIVWDGHWNLFVADFGNNRIARFDYHFVFQTAYGSKGSGPGEFNNPCALAVGPDGNLYVADTWNGRVQVLTRDGTFVRQFGAGTLYGPRGIAVDRKGHVYVSDTGNNRVVRFGADGVKDATWGGPGTAPGRFSSPSGLAVDAQGTVYVCDVGNGRLQLFSPDGKFRRALPVPGWGPGPLGEPHVAISRYGEAWVTVPLEREVRGIHLKTGKSRVFRNDEKWHQPFRVPLGIATEPTLGSVVITDDQGWVVPLSFALLHGMR